MKRRFLFLTFSFMAFAWPSFLPAQANELPRKEFINIFESDIYNEFFYQLNSFKKGKEGFAPSKLIPESQHPFSQAFLHFLHHLDQPLKASSESKGEYHYQLITHLRAALEQRFLLGNPAESPLKEQVQFLDDFTEWMFTFPNVSSSTKEFLASKTSLDEGTLLAAYLQSPTRYLFNIHKYLAAHPKFKVDKKAGLPKNLEDNFLFGDFPSTLFSLKGGTQTIRFSNVARDLEIDPKTGRTLAAKVNEEFINFIHTRGAKGHKHLYINCLNRHKGEKIKTKAIESLEMDPYTRDSIYVVTFDKENSSDFYYQTGHYEKMFSAKEFKERLFQELFKEDGLFYWSRKLDLSTWKVQVQHLIQEVHQIFFKNHEVLTKAQRQDYIELTYIKMIDALVELLKPSTLNVTCKQAVDRGPSLYSLLYLYDRKKAGPLDFSHFVEFTQLVFIPPLAFHDRATHHYRIYRIQGVANRLAKANFQPGL